MSHSDVVGIRLAQRVELATLTELFADQEVPFDPQHWRRQAESEKSFTCVVEQTHIFGFVTAGPADLPDTDLGEVSGFFLMPDRRGVGLTRKLLVRALSSLKRQGFGRALIFLAEPNDVARLLVDLQFVVSAYIREVNVKGAVLQQQGYELSLEDYF